ncbi:MAG: hypothetical protein R3C20_14035 [Planctomycetaceae bacterium]
MEKARASERPYYRRAWFWAVMPVAFIAISLVIAGLVAGNRLERQMAEIRLAGLPIGFADLDEFYVLPEGTADTTTLWIEAINVAAAIRLDDTTRTLPFIGEGDLPRANEDWDQIELAQQFLKTHEAALRIIHQAADAGGAARFPVQLSAGPNAVLSSAFESRQVARLLQLEAAVFARTNRHDRALKSTLAIHAVSSALQAEPVLLTHLMRIAISAMASNQAVELAQQGHWNDSQLAQLQRAADIDFLKELKRALCTERAFSVSIVQSAGLGPLGRSNASTYLQLSKPVIDATDQGWDQTIAAAAEQAAEIRRLSTNRSMSRWFNLSASMLIPGANEAVSTVARNVAMQRAAILALAAIRYQKARQVPPTTIAELTSLIPELANAGDVSIDPFTNQPFRLRWDDSQLTIYSLGPNQTDDQGSVQMKEAPIVPLDIGYSILCP